MRFLPVLLAVGIVMSSFAALSADEKEAEAKSGKVLRHVVMFKFKADASEAQIKSVTDAFALLPKKIDAIKEFEWGTDVSEENASKGFTHCFLVTFADEKGRAEYLPHAAHDEFVKSVKPLVDDVMVIDYWSKK